MHINSNIRNYSIFLKQPENLLFAYFVGTDYQADTAAMAADPVTREWWDLCMPMQQPLDTQQGEWWASVDEVFRTD